MITIGLTGNMGSGKSTAAAYLAQLGAAVIDADVIGHQIIAKGGSAYRPLLAAFGDSFLDRDGEFDRRALGKYIFSDASGQRTALLNSITHPLIRDEIRRQIADLDQQGYPAAVIEAAVLFESEMAPLMDKIWLISAPQNELLTRIRQRDSLADDDILARLNRQMTPAQIAKLADIVIVNDGNLDQFREQLAYQYNKLLKERA